MEDYARIEHEERTHAGGAAVWTECTAADGAPYYYNTATQETVWTQPPELKLARDPEPEPETEPKLEFLTPAGVRALRRRRHHRRVLGRHDRDVLDAALPRARRREHLTKQQSLHGCQFS